MLSAFMVQTSRKSILKTKTIMMVKGQVSHPSGRKYPFDTFTNLSSISAEGTFTHVCMVNVTS